MTIVQRFDYYLSKTRYNSIPVPESLMEYHYYDKVKGELVKLSNKTEDSNLNFIGYFIANKVEINTASALVQHEYNKAIDMFHSDIKSWFRETLYKEYINSQDYDIDKLFSVIYDRAYSEGHSSGHDNVYNCLQSELNHLIDILKVL